MREMWRPIGQVSALPGRMLLVQASGSGLGRALERAVGRLI